MKKSCWTVRALRPAGIESLERRVLLAADGLAELTNAAPMALFSAGGSVELGSGATLSFRQIEDSAEDVAAGFTYSYDLGNDGEYEITSASPTFQVPASLLGAPDTYRFLGRITDRWGAYTDHSAELRVTVPPDYFPTVAGLTWYYSGMEDDSLWRASVRSLYDTHDGERLFVLEQEVVVEGELTRSYHRLEGDKVGLVYQLITDPKLTAEATVSPAPMTGVFSHPDGWSSYRPGVTYTIRFISAATGERVADVSAKLDQTETGSRGPLQLTGGMHFTDALMVELVEVGSARYVLPEYTRDEQIRATTKSWYVRGYGLVREEYSAQTDWRESTGESGTEVENDYHEVGGVATWAKFAMQEEGGILRVNGTSQDDDIRFELRGEQLTVFRNGLPDGDNLWVGNFRGIMIDGLGGNDRIDLTGLAVPATIVGGSGNDTITGGAGADVMYGGDGDDLLAGVAGSDTIYGNFGDDVIMGGLQRDSLMGGIGDDTITAGDGPDSVYGGDGRDEIRGGKGADYMEGKGKSDVIYGGVGNDTIHGNAGDDLVYADDGDDNVYVNDGAVLVFHDTVYAGLGADVVDWDGWDWVLDEEGGVGVLV